MASSWELSREIREREAIARQWICENAGAIAERVKSILEDRDSKIQLEGHGVVWGRILTLQVNLCDTYTISWVIDNCIPLTSMFVWQEMADRIANHLLCWEVRLGSELKAPIVVTIGSMDNKESALYRSPLDLMNKSALVAERLTDKLRDRVSPEVLVNIERIYWLGFSWGLGEPKYLAWLIWRWITNHSSWVDYTNYEGLWNCFLNYASIATSEAKTDFPKATLSVPTLEDIPF